MYTIINFGAYCKGTAYFAVWFRGQIENYHKIPPKIWKSTLFNEFWHFSNGIELINWMALYADHQVGSFDISNQNTNTHTRSHPSTCAEFSINLMWKTNKANKELFNQKKRIHIWHQNRTKLKFRQCDRETDKFVHPLIALHVNTCVRVCMCMCLILTSVIFCGKSIGFDFRESVCVCVCLDFFFFEKKSHCFACHHAHSFVRSLPPVDYKNHFTLLWSINWFRKIEKWMNERILEKKNQWVANRLQILHTKNQIDCFSVSFRFRCIPYTFLLCTIVLFCLWFGDAYLCVYVRERCTYVFSRQT